MELVDIGGCQCRLTVPGQGETPIRRRWLLFRADVFRQSFLRAGDCLPVCIELSLWRSFLPMVAFKFSTLPLQGTQSEFLPHPRGTC